MKHGEALLFQAMVYTQSRFLGLGGGPNLICTCKVHYYMLYVMQQESQAPGVHKVPFLEGV